MDSCETEKCIYKHGMGWRFVYKGNYLLIQIAIYVVTTFTWRKLVPLPLNKVFPWLTCPVTTTFPYSVELLVVYPLIKRWRLANSCCRGHTNYGLKTCALLSRNTDLALYQFGKWAFWLRSNTQIALQTCRKERCENAAFYLFILYNLRCAKGYQQNKARGGMK